MATFHTNAQICCRTRWHVTVHDAHCGPGCSITVKYLCEKERGEKKVPLAHRCGMRYAMRLHKRKLSLTQRNRNAGQQRERRAESERCVWRQKAVGRTLMCVWWDE